MIEEKIIPGKRNRLKIDRVTAPGLYLVSQDTQESILLPNQYITKSMLVGDEIEVFVYFDSEDRLVATTHTPFAMRDEFALLEVVDSVRFGLFLDWGLPKDILLPKNKQKGKASVGQKIVVQIVCDEKTSRLIATQKIHDALSSDTSRFAPGDEVDILVYDKTPLGFKVIVNNTHEGLIFKNEVFDTLKIGEKKKAYVKNITEEKKLDISLQAIGSKAKELAKQKVYKIIQEKKSLPINTKSAPEQIYNEFGLSKKIFKSALNTLAQENKVILHANGVDIKNA